MLMTAADYRESLRRYRPRVFVDGRAVDSVADEPLLAPGIAAIGVTYDFAHERGACGADDGAAGDLGQDRQPDAAHRRDRAGPAVQARGGAAGLPRSPAAPSATSPTMRSTRSSRRRSGPTTRTATDYHPRFLAYLHGCRTRTSTLGIAMTDAKGDRSQAARASRPIPDVYVHIKERRPDGIVIRGTKAIVTGAPYMHEFLVMPCRTHDAGGQRLRRLLRGAGRCAGRHHHRRGRRAGRARRRRSSPPSTASRPASCMFDDVFVPREPRVPRRRDRGGRLPHDRATPRTTGIPASARGPASATC